MISRQHPAASIPELNFQLRDGDAWLGQVHLEPAWLYECAGFFPAGSVDEHSLADECWLRVGATSGYLSRPHAMNRRLRILGCRTKLTERIADDGPRIHRQISLGRSETYVPVDRL
jgi:hypothetical protein